MAVLLSGTTIGGHVAVHANNISTYALTSLPSHNHDDRYFTESESDGRFFFAQSSQLANTNLNDLTTRGVYYSADQYGTNSNIPFANYFTMINLTNDSARQAQLWFGDTPGRAYWRPRQGDATWHPWEQLITSNNIGSQSVNYASSAGNADTVDGFHREAFPYRADGTSGYYQVADWMQFNTTAGIYWPSYNGAHIYANTTGTYGSIRIDGSRNGWEGIYFNSGATLMMNATNVGIFRHNVGWYFEWTNGSLIVYKGTGGGGTAATVIDSSTIGSQSVNYATSAGNSSTTSQRDFNYLSSRNINIGSWQSYHIGTINASATQARKFLIAKIGIDYNDWNSVGMFEVELAEQYYFSGGRKRYIVNYGYGGVNSIQLIEANGVGTNNGDVIVEGPTQIGGDHYVLSVYARARYYGSYTCLVRTTRSTTGSNPPGVGQTVVFTDPSPENISDFTPATDVYITSGQYAVAAPRYYDSDDTNYYIDPNGASKLNGLHIVSSGNQVSGYDASLYIGGNNNDWGIIVGKSSYDYGISVEVSGSATYAYASPNFRVSGAGAVYSTILYDQDTRYYVDPNSMSSVYGVAIRGDLSSTDTSNQIFFWGGGNGTTSAIGFKASGGYFENPTGFGDGYNTYFTMDSDGRGWVFRRGNGGSDFGAAYTSGWILNNGVWQANASMRAPIFYDSDDTGFYGDFNSRSVLNSLQLGSAASDISNLKLDVQGNMAIRGANGLYFGVSTNNYNSWSTRIYASGSTQYFNAQQFIFDNQGYGGTTFVTINSAGVYTNGWFRNYGNQGIYNQDYGTHFYSNNSEGYVLTGSGTHVQLQLRSNHQSTLRGYVYADTSNNIGFLSEDGNWVLRTWNRGVEAYGSMRAPIFYDSNDTNYYGDFAGFSRMSEIGVTNNYVYNYFNVESSRAVSEFGNVGVFRARRSAAADYPSFSFQHQFGNHSWGQIARFHIEQSSADRPSIQFSSGTNNTRWNVGYCYPDDDFRISQNMGYRPDGSGVSDGWGTERLRINGNGQVFIPQLLYTTEVAATNGNGRVYLNGNLHIDSYNGNDIYMNYYSARGTRIYVGSGTLALHVNTDGLVYMPTVVVNSHSDNTKGYRISNTSGTTVSAMFVNSSNQLVIAAGAVDQVNLNKKVLVNGVALGVNVAPSATAGRIDASNDIVAYSSSDERLKQNITPIENALDKVKSLTGVEFDWKPEYKDAHGYEGHDTGVIAQQVEAVMPSAVRTNDTGFLAVRYEKLIGLLIEGMKEQQVQIDELKEKIDGLTK